MPEKSVEQRILQAVYDETKYAEVLESECPDFQLRHQGHQTFFGVEVTEAYDSQPRARLYKIPGYFTEIIEHDHFRHKDDIEALQPKVVTIRDKDGTYKSTARVLVQQVRKPQEQSKILTETIRAKEARLQNYKQDLDHTNLIVFDPDAEFWYLHDDYIYHHLYTPELKEALFASNFREIFFIATTHEGRQVYMRLKMLLLLAEFRMFLQLVIDYPWEATEDAPELLEGNGWSGKGVAMQLFAKYLRSKTEAVYTRKNGRTIEVIFGACGMTWGKKQILIFNRADYPLEADVKPVSFDEVTVSFQSAEFLEKAEQILMGRVFTSPIGIYDVNIDPRTRKRDSMRAYARTIQD